MTLTPERRTTLPLIDLPSAAHALHARGKRSAVTCALKCGNACSHPVPNESDNDYFPDIADKALSRRSVLGAGAATGLVLTFAGPVAAAAAKPKPGSAGLAFEAISAVTSGTDTFNVPVGYRWAALIRWGDPILKGAPAFDPANQSEAAQAMQFGYNCDYLDVIALDDKLRKKAVAVVNHEYTNENIMFPPTTDPAQIKANKRTAIAAHGLSVVSLKRAEAGDPWRLDPSKKLNRRITGMTEFLVDGPAAGSDLLKTKDDPTGTRVLGTFNNCSGGTTPWGTVLSGEENFNQYFLVPDAPGPRRPRRAPRAGATACSAPSSRPATTAPGGTSSRASTPRRLATRTSRTASGGSSRSTRWTRTRPRSSTRRWAASSTRRPTSGSPRAVTSSRTPATTSASTTSTSSSPAAGTTTPAPPPPGAAT